MSIMHGIANPVFIARLQLIWKSQLHNLQDIPQLSEWGEEEYPLFGKQRTPSDPTIVLDLENEPITRADPPGGNTFVMEW